MEAVFEVSSSPVAHEVYLIRFGTLGLGLASNTAGWMDESINDLKLCHFAPIMLFLDCFIASVVGPLLLDAWYLDTTNMALLPTITTSATTVSLQLLKIMVQ